MYAGHYYYYYDTTGTAPTVWGPSAASSTCTRDNYCYVTPVSTLKLPAPVPKWWRWYDVFRTWAKPKLLRLLDGAWTRVRRVQERYPLGQRRKQKRRTYVQALHAL